MKYLTIFFAILTCFIISATCNFYMGMFQRNDLLVAQDRLYKEMIPYRIQFAKYGRVFKCPITYLRVVDRLGYGPPPKTKIIRGGLQKKYVVLRLSAYNRPISVNIYVGCQNKLVEKVAPKPKDKIGGGTAKPTTKKKGGTEKNSSSPTDQSTTEGKTETNASGSEQPTTENGTNASDTTTETSTETLTETSTDTTTTTA